MQEQESLRGLPSVSVLHAECLVEVGSWIVASSGIREGKQQQHAESFSRKGSSGCYE